jgi:hypothetical protein
VLITNWHVGLLCERTDDMQSRWLKHFTPDPQVGEACAYGKYVSNLPCTANVLLRSMSAKRLRWRRSRSYERRPLPSRFFLLQPLGSIECGGSSHPVSVTDIYHAIDGASPNASRVSILFERPLKYSGGSTQIDKGKLFFKLFFLHALSITCRRKNHDNFTGTCNFIAFYEQ